MIIDKGTVITGSFNFTKAAGEKNAENLLTDH
jgi:phosphatidylserine/phosphatidylglycerophosphate/cardiolipin synthase-like enzyme